VTGSRFRAAIDAGPVPRSLAMPPVLLCGRMAPTYNATIVAVTIQPTLRCLGIIKNDLQCEHGVSNMAFSFAAYFKRNDYVR
jgi:hypothetical protein